jgi:hypothetical protein
MTNCETENNFMQGIVILREFVGNTEIAKSGEYSLLYDLLLMYVCCVRLISKMVLPISR